MMDKERINAFKWGVIVGIVTGVIVTLLALGIIFA